ncbi:uncharacterized protein LOC119431899 [Dermacentor silvarum]|uniref:uncharacterized protein LOC119431899 n=1 Tax=Dermacentor silvarum TaxID=543639 RepID=UPI002100EE09|nr:uncharacterized protein LOC119431899 [Dermacentor silvarum]
MPKLFAVVQFPLENNSIATVPLSWLDEDSKMCVWPENIRNSEVVRLVEELAQPGETGWRSFPVSVVATSRKYTHHGAFSTYFTLIMSFQPGNEGVPRQAAPSVELPLPPAELKSIHLLLDIRHQLREGFAQIKQELQLVSERLDRLESKSSPAVPQAAPPTLPQLPAKTVEDVEVAEQSLQDEDVAAALRKQLVRLGGTSLRDTASNILNGLMGHEVQLQFSLHGKKGKRAFVNTRLCRVATDAICEKQGVDVREAHDFIKRWLPGAIDRAGGRRRRYAEAALLAQPLPSATFSAPAAPSAPDASSASTLSTGSVPA